MKRLSTLVLILIGLQTVDAQDCTAYIPYEEGTLTEQTHYNKKGKVTGTTTQIVKEIEKKGNATLFHVMQTSLDKKGENEMVTDMTFRCEDNVFYVDMNAFVNEEQMAAYKDMDIKITMEAINIPPTGRWQHNNGHPEWGPYSHKIHHNGQKPPGRQSGNTYNTSR